MIRTLIRVVLAMLLLVAVAAPSRQPQTLEQQLREILEHKTVKLRNFYIGRDLKYDPQGRLVSKAEVGTWTLDCFLQVKEVKIKKNELEIQTMRLAVIFDPLKKEMRLAVVPEYNTKIVLQLAPDADLTSVDGALGRVFLTNNDSLETLVPQEWQWFLAKPFAAYDRSSLPGGDLIRTPAKPKGEWVEAAPTGTREERPQLTAPKDADEVLPGGTPVFRALGQATAMEKVYRVAGGIKPPRATFIPDPEYPERARSLHAQGTTVLWAIVKPDGSASDVKISRPFGLGLDESAVAAVKRWKFNPATKDGKPVAVQIDIEVNFRLY